MTDLVPLSHAEMFSLADQISKSAMIPASYRGKPVDAAIAMMYGAEAGIGPMTALQRIVVINGRPTFDAQGMTALIRRAGHSVTGDISNTGASVTGKRGDTGDVMTATFTLDDAKAAGLVKPNSPWTKFTEDMLWSRAVSRLGRRLFPDVLLGLSYVPDEMQAVVDDQGPSDTTITGLVTDLEIQSTVREPPAALQPADPDTGEIIDTEPIPVPDDADEMMKALADIVRETPNNLGLKGELLAKFGPSKDLSPERLQEAITFAAGWAPAPEPLFQGDDGAAF